MENIDKEILNIISDNDKKNESEETIIKQKDGLLEHSIINKKLVTSDGRQLLKEIVHQA